MPEKPSTKPFGYYITYRDSKGETRTCGRIASSEGRARSSMRQLYHCREVLSLEPMDLAAYVRTFGYGRM